MNSEIKDSNKAHERHDSTGVTVAKVTWKVANLRPGMRKLKEVRSLSCTVGKTAVMKRRVLSGSNASSVKEYFKSRLGLAST